MHITKHVHSCLLVEDEGKTVLIDPGEYTAEENALDLDSINQLDYLLITHEHPDHCYVPLIKEIKAKFPNVKMISNASVAEILEKEGLEVNNEGDDFISLKLVSHEYVFGNTTMPQNCLFTINKKLTHPGDSLSFDETAEILALPVQAPWGTITQAAQLAAKLKPKIVIPIHDWHWNQKAREGLYKRLEDYFKGLGIKFKTEV